MGRILAEIAGRIATLLAVYDEDFYNLLCDAQGHLQIDVLESALPSGAATATNQATIITAVQSLQNLVGALHDVGIDELDVIVESSALPSGAATETTLDEIMDRLGDETSPASGSANAQLADIVTRIGALTTPAGGSTNKLLTDALTSLQLIDNLYGALHSVNTDEVVVRGEDQLFSINAPIAFLSRGYPSAENGYRDTVTPPDGHYYVIQALVNYSETAALTEIITYKRVGTDLFDIHQDKAAFAVGQRSPWSGIVILAHDQVLRVYFTGAGAEDTVDIIMTGYDMTVET